MGLLVQGEVSKRYLFQLVIFGTLHQERGRHCIVFGNLAVK
jgi:hypothetical protein